MSATADGALLYARVSTPIGPIWVARSHAGVVRISMRSRTEAAFLADLTSSAGPRAPRPRKDPAAMARATGQLAEYFQGARRRFLLDVDLEALTPFQRRVLGATARIPYGQVVSYGDIAKAIGSPGASRAVGNALGSNPVPIVIPCHRVVSGAGTIGGFTGGTPLKRRLLAVEGIAL